MQVVLKKTRVKKIKSIDVPPPEFCPQQMQLEAGDEPRLPAGRRSHSGKKLMLALSWRPKISGVSLMGKPRMYAR